MSEQQLLFEELSPSQAGLITESSPDGKFTWLNGIFMQGGIKNRNGRVYPITEIQAAVQNAQQRITETNGIFGELDHPQTLTINLDRISHVITELSVEGNNAIGKAKLLNTPMGNIAKELAASGVALGVSSRGAGQVDESGGVRGFNFVTVDIVAQPSAPNAYPQTVVEGLEQARNGHNILDLAEAVKEDPAAQKYLRKEIMNWLETGLFAKKK
jgi:hypothetical protein